MNSPLLIYFTKQMHAVEFIDVSNRVILASQIWTNSMKAKRWGTLATTHKGSMIYCNFRPVNKV